MFDDFTARISAEEYYSERRYARVSCDNCKERVSVSNVHELHSFERPDTVLLICGRCYGKWLHQKGGNKPS